jgi:hypothetical protein
VFHHGLVVRLGSRGYGFLRDFKTKKRHIFSFHAGETDFLVGDRVKFQLGPKQLCERKDKSLEYSARAFNVQRLD